MCRSVPFARHARTKAKKADGRRRRRRRLSLLARVNEQKITKSRTMITWPTRRKITCHSVSEQTFPSNTFVFCIQIDRPTAGAFFWHRTTIKPDAFLQLRWVLSLLFSVTFYAFHMFHHREVCVGLVLAVRQRACESTTVPARAINAIICL